MAIEILLRFLWPLASILRTPRYPIDFIERQTIPFFIALYFMRITLVSRWNRVVEGNNQEGVYQSVGQKTVVKCWLPSLSNLSVARQRYTSNFVTVSLRLFVILYQRQSTTVRNLCPLVLDNLTAVRAICVLTSTWQFYARLTIL